MGLFEHAFGIALHGGITEAAVQEELLPEIMTRLRINGAKNISRTPDGLSFEGGCFSDWRYGAMTKTARIRVEQRSDRIVPVCRTNVQSVFIHLLAMALGSLAFTLIPWFFVGIRALPFTLGILIPWAAATPLGIVWVNWRTEKFLRQVIVDWSRQALGIDGAAL